MTGRELIIALLTKGFDLDDNIVLVVGDEVAEDDVEIYSNAYNDIVINASKEKRR